MTQTSTFTSTCRICHERIESADGPFNWTHSRGDVDCGTGDGSVALPDDWEWFERLTARFPDRDLSVYQPSSPKENP